VVETVQKQVKVSKQASPTSGGGQVELDLRSPSGRALPF
jgi:hypothetical protein